MNQTDQTPEQRVAEIREEHSAQVSLRMAINEPPTKPILYVEFLLSEHDRLKESLEKANGLLLKQWKEIEREGEWHETDFPELTDYLKSQSII